MTRLSTKGRCSFCGGSYAKSAMARHLKACKTRAEENDEPAAGGSARGSAVKAILHIQAEGRYLPMFWMHIEIPESATLKDLDEFLRDTWLECCGHLSSFNIAGSRFYSREIDPGDRSMRIAVGKVLGSGMKFEHTYDFGTSTVLSLKVISARMGLAKGKAVRVMARNDPPDIRCQSCGEPATFVCSQCVCNGAGLVCDECAKKHECGEDMFLPVVNSPRVGMCGYTGDAY
jgi:hypothetical protein